MISRKIFIWRSSRVLLAIISVSVGLTPFKLSAQSNTQTTDAIDSRTTTVQNRTRPELDPLGMRTSGFVIFPSVDVGVGFDDNIFASQTNTRDDIITTVTPAVRISSDWNQHYLSFSGSGDIVRYADNDAEDHETFELTIDSRIDIRRDTKLTANAQYELGSEGRGSVDDVGGTTPTEFDVRSAAAEIIHKPNRLSLGVGGRLAQLDFDDVATSTGTVNNDDRDRDEASITFRGGYTIQNQYEAFAQVILSSINYDAAVDDNGVNRDNEGYEIRAGARIDITGVLFGDVFVGYLNRDYDDATLQSVDTIVGGVDLTWNVTRLTTVSAGFERIIDETTLATASGNLRTSYKISADHELLRSLILSARLGVSKDEFEGTSREDDYLGVGFGARYILNRNFSFAFDYDYSERDANIAGSDYEINKIMLRLQAHL